MPPLWLWVSIWMRTKLYEYLAGRKTCRYVIFYTLDSYSLFTFACRHVYIEESLGSHWTFHTLFLIIIHPLAVKIKLLHSICLRDVRGEHVIYAFFWQHPRNHTRPPFNNFQKRSVFEDINAICSNLLDFLTISYLLPLRNTKRKFVMKLLFQMCSIVFF